MDNKLYEKILKEGERVDWYGELVPKELINGKVIVWSDRLKSEIDKLEGELSDLKGTELEKRKGYLKALYKNLKDSPYSLNGDFYLIKKKRIDLEMEEESKKVKKTKVKETTKTVTKTKNSDLIFGKKKK
jgi:hypothetical protein